MMIPMMMNDDTDDTDDTDNTDDTDDNGSEHVTQGPNTTDRRKAACSRFAKRARLGKGQMGVSTNGATAFCYVF